MSDRRLDRAHDRQRFPGLPPPAWCVRPPRPAVRPPGRHRPPRPLASPLAPSPLVSPLALAPSRPLPSHHARARAPPGCGRRSRVWDKCGPPRRGTSASSDHGNGLVRSPLPVGADGARAPAGTCVFFGNASGAPAAVEPLRLAALGSLFDAVSAFIFVGCVDWDSPMSQLFWTRNIEGGNGAPGSSHARS
eukprot:COSAG01_NODE_11676_length_1882_cov_6.104319_2_plen_191_part_00